MDSISHAQDGSQCPAGQPKPAARRQPSQQAGTDVVAGAAPGRVTLLGHGGAMLRRPLEFLASLPAHGDLVEIRMGPWPFHVICHPELNGYAVHQRADLYPRPAVFDPDRWIDQRTPRGGFLAFGGGRKCIGDVFGLTQIAVALATIAGRWRLAPARPSRVRPVARTQRAALGYPMRVTAR
ncbi:cytochrome P450 [Streptomyces sp. NPDC052020]|uniref:cytochrome P450 n=1 Tax=Streptomyces sp. NPDC052020 TaxID=3155677 RepID=UPI003428F6A5